MTAPTRRLGPRPWPNAYHRHRRRMQTDVAYAVMFELARAGRLMMRDLQRMLQPVWAAFAPFSNDQDITRVVRMATRKTQLRAAAVHRQPWDRR